MLSPPAFAPLRVRSVPSSTHSSALGYVTREVKVLFSATLQPWAGHGGGGSEPGRGQHDRGL